MRLKRIGLKINSSPRNVSTFSVFRPFHSFRRQLRSCRVYRMTTRNMDKKAVKKIKADNQDSKRVRSTSFSGQPVVHGEHAKQIGTRRPSVSRQRHGLPVPAWSEKDPEYSWNLPGKAVGYKRLWMQNNPWPECVAKETGSKREGVQDHIHRTKFRETRRLAEPAFVPGGNCKDPLNLRAVGLGEELPGMSPIPEPDPGRFDLPANNFIPYNQKDPLGLFQSEDDQTPVALKYPLRPKRKRIRGKKKDHVGGEASASHSQANLNAADMDTESTAYGDARTSLDSDDPEMISDHSVNAEANNESDVAMDVINTSQTDGEICGDKNVTNDSMGVSKSAECDAGSTTMETNLSQDPNASESESAVCTTSDINKTDESKEEEKVMICQSSADNNVSFNVQETSDNPELASFENGQLEQTSKSELISPSKTVPSNHQNKHKSEQQKKPKLELDQKLKKIQQKHLLYPVPQSPIDDLEKEQVPKNRKSLRKALKIDPMKPEEQAKVNKEREKKEREFRRRRYPNLKSPEDDEDQIPTDRKSLDEALRIDTDLSPEKSHQEQILLHRPPSRTIESIVSPIMLPSTSQIRKRRRTISECNTESAPGATKRLHFRRSSSPDCRTVSQVSPRKIRRQNNGQGQKEKEKKPTDTNQPQATVKYAKNATYKHGNYYRYYGYRTPDLAPDFRLYYFKKDWFEGKDVLDIGCNAGDVTLAVAQLFHPQKIVGMDIDPNLIRMARQNIRSHQTKANMYQMEKYPVSTNEYGPIEPLPALTNPSNIFPKNIMFMQGNYVLKSDDQLDHVKEEYDTILALSITKWIHLNHGDEGLKRAFHRMFQQLRPGGRLILEPQSWASYRRRKKLSPVIFKNYTSIELKPSDFASYLVNTVGFCKREFLGQPFNPSKGFQRPLLLFTKYKDTPDSSPWPENCPNRMGPPPLQYSSISERMTFLAGYSPYTPNPDLYCPGPSSSSPAVLYHSRFLDRHAASRLYPPLSASASFCELYNAPSGDEGCAGNYGADQSYGAESSVDYGAEQSSACETSSQLEAGESFCSSSPSSSVCFSASHTSTDSCSLHEARMEQSASSTAPPPVEDSMQWQEGEQVGGGNDDVMGNVESIQWQEGEHVGGDVERGETIPWQDGEQDGDAGPVNQSDLCNGHETEAIAEGEVMGEGYGADFSPDQIDAGDVTLPPLININQQHLSDGHSNTVEDNSTSAASINASPIQSSLVANDAATVNNDNNSSSENVNSSLEESSFNAGTIQNESNAANVSATNVNASPEESSLVSNEAETVSNNNNNTGVENVNSSPEESNLDATTPLNDSNAANVNFSPEQSNLNATTLPRDSNAANVRTSPGRSNLGNNSRAPDTPAINTTDDSSDENDNRINAPRREQSGNDSPFWDSEMVTIQQLGSVLRGLRQQLRHHVSSISPNLDSAEYILERYYDDQIRPRQQGWIPLKVEMIAQPRDQEASREQSQRVGEGSRQASAEQDEGESSANSGEQLDASTSASSSSAPSQDRQQVSANIGEQVQAASTSSSPLQDRQEPSTNNGQVLEATSSTSALLQDKQESSTNIGEQLEATSSSPLQDRKETSINNPEQLKATSSSHLQDGQETITNNPEQLKATCSSSPLQQNERETTTTSSDGQEAMIFERQDQQGSSSQQTGQSQGLSTSSVGAGEVSHSASLEDQGGVTGGREEPMETSESPLEKDKEESSTTS